MLIFNCIDFAVPVQLNCLIHTGPCFVSTLLKTIQITLRITVGQSSKISLISVV